MTSFTSNATSPATTGSSFALLAFVSSLFQVELREKLDALLGGDKSDAAYHWGL
jgi:hypothetical protein